MNPFEIQIGGCCSDDDDDSPRLTEQDLIDAALLYGKELENIGSISYLIYKNGLWMFGVDGMTLGTFVRPESAVFFAKAWLSKEQDQWIDELMEFRFPKLL